MSDDVAARAVDILDRGDDLATLVREHFGRPTLEPTLRALLQLAFVYDRRGDKTTSCAIIDAVQTARTAFQATKPTLPPRTSPLPKGPRPRANLLDVRARQTR